MATKTAFTKNPLNSSAHLALLKKRGMTFSEAEESLAYQLFSYVGYFRLSGYSIPFQIQPKLGDAQHTFKPNTSFSQVAELYRFDEALRHLCTEALQRIEVALRTVVCNKLSLKYDTPQWFNVKSIFIDDPDPANTLIARIYKALEFDPSTNSPISNRRIGNYQYIDKYYAKHIGPAPGWMLREVGSFGLWSKIFSNLRDSAIRQTIANEFKYPDKKAIDETLLRGWTHTLSVLRNLCAHHHRLVYRSMSFAPGTPNATNWAAIVPPNSSAIRSMLGVIALLERNTMTGSTWLTRVKDLLDQYDSSVNIDAALGFQTAWRKDSIWSIGS